MVCFMLEENVCDNSDYFDIDSLSENDRKILQLRIERHDPIPENSLICITHRKKFLTSYSACHQKCCDPCQRHKNPIRSNLRIADLEDHQKYKDFLGVHIIPGKKICTNCLVFLNSQIKQESQGSTTSDNTTSSQKTTPGLSQAFSTPEEFTIEYLDSFLEKISLNPIKRSSHFHKLSNKVTYAKNKLNLITDVLEQKIKHILHIPDHLTLTDNQDSENINELMEHIKKKN